MYSAGLMRMRKFKLFPILATNFLPPFLLHTRHICERATTQFSRDEVKWFSRAAMCKMTHVARASIRSDARERMREMRVKGPHRLARVYYFVMAKRLVRSPYVALTVARATCTWLIIMHADRRYRRATVIAIFRLSARATTSDALDRPIVGN